LENFGFEDKKQHQAATQRGGWGNLHHMTTQGSGTGGDAAAMAPHAFDLKWALRRSLLGVLILAIGIGGAAWLTHASIDPTLEAAASEPLR
jgi:hypothetical protein